jgi:hypothetical protein
MSTKEVKCPRVKVAGDGDKAHESSTNHLQEDQTRQVMVLAGLKMFALL